MHRLIRLSTMLLLLICAALASSSADGQSLSILKKGESNYSIEASPPATNFYILQASEDLRLWVDIHGPVQGQFSYDFGGTTGILQRYFRLVVSPPSLPPIVVMLLGDSMVADCCGWGGGIYGYFKTNATVVNYAMPWTSTKVFLQSAELDKMLLVKPNYVLIQYGYVDSADTDPDRFTTLEEFGNNLRTIVQAVRGFNGVPILVTLHSMRRWDESGHIIPSWQDRNAVTQTVATELQTHLIDLNQLTLELFNQLGPSGTEFMHWEPGGPDDNMHFSWAGAVVVARLVVNALPESLGPYLTGTLAQ